MTRGEGANAQVEKRVLSWGIHIYSTVSEIKRKIFGSVCSVREGVSGARNIILCADVPCLLHSVITTT